MIAAATFIGAAAPHYGQTIQTVADDGDKPIGTIAWTIQEVATGKVLDQGHMTVLLKDVSIKDMAAARLQAGWPTVAIRSELQKQLRLNDKFTLQMAEFPSRNKSDKTGFGLVAEGNDAPTFSWEWFLIKTDHRAQKGQENGELGIALTQIGSEWEVTRTEFLTDVRFRVARKGIDKPGSFTWTVTILKGSTITWPSLVNGRVVAN
jgi:hypothetical protein